MVWVHIRTQITVTGNATQFIVISTTLHRGQDRLPFWSRLDRYGQVRSIFVFLFPSTATQTRARGIASRRSGPCRSSLGFTIKATVKVIVVSPCMVRSRSVMLYLGKDRLACWCSHKTSGDSWSVLNLGDAKSLKPWSRFTTVIGEQAVCLCRL